MNPEWSGACFVVCKHAAEADHRFKLMRVNVDGLPHYYLTIGYKIVDLTASQFDSNVDYSKGRNPGKWWK
jgi:hypothetical protein